MAHDRDVGPHRAPVIGAGANENTITEYTSSWPLCVQPGDRIGLASVGGFDAKLFPRGLPYQVFGAQPATTMRSSAPAARSPSARRSMRGERVPDTELLLQVVIGTGPDARPTCGGSTAPDPDPEPPPTGDPRARGTIPKPARAPRMFDGKVRLTLRCATAARCAGVLSLRARGKRIGRRAYTLDAGETDGVSVTLSPRGTAHGAQGGTPARDRPGRRRGARRGRASLDRPGLTGARRRDC